MMCRLALIVFALWTTTAFAHGPLDHSVRITLMDPGREVGVTLGPDLAEQALTRGGLAPDQVRQLLVSHGPSGHGVVAPEALATLVELDGPDGRLIPTRTVVMTDGLEYMFVANYPRPQGSRLSLVARYLDAVEDLPPGSLELVDEDAGRLAMEPLNLSRKSVALSLPSSPGEAALPMTTGAAAVPAATADVADALPTAPAEPAAAQGPSRDQPGRGSKSKWGWWLLAALLGVGAGWIWHRRHAA